MNDHESETLAGLLADAGHRAVFSEDEADLVLFNTCAVRHKAEQKAYSEIGRLRKVKERRPDIIIGVGGCMAQSEGRAVFSRAPFVDLVFGTKSLSEVPDMVRRVSEDRRRIVSTSMDEDPESVREFYSHAKGDGVKAFVTVMQGCDNFCSYCIVPFVRGREVSRPSADIVEEVRRLSEDGVREVTLLGQNVNSYGLKGGDGADFAELVRRVALLPDISRIRFTTSHPKDLSDGLIGLFASEPKLMAHLHLPLQSGSDRILKAMNRGYGVERYFGLVERLRAACPDIALTADMIVGFPGETEEDFRATLAAMERVRFDNLFSFKYSPRTGTAAERLKEQVPEDVKEDRLARLHEVQRVHTLEINRNLIGQTTPVLAEGVSKSGGGQMTGRTPGNKVINFRGGPELAGATVRVVVTEAYANSLMGKLEDDAQNEG